ncbi:FAD-dependent oxidoreductase [Massilia niabensis]|uniref:FAD-dependent oxidoreductase n=1 Tax=Massilia niabensis TaxID=544910 RepID=A0ABW0L7U0_9BURK
MKRRELLKASMAAALLSAGNAGLAGAAQAQPGRYARVRPGDAGWPGQGAWEQLRRDTGGSLRRVEPAFTACAANPVSPACADMLEQLANPYFIGDHPAMTQTSGWQDAWLSRPSAYAVRARNAADVSAAVRFASRHRLRLVVKGGGHSYLGTSNAPDSLLVWTRAMNDAVLHQAFVPAGGNSADALPAVSLGAGAMWSDAYAAVTTRGGRYVQGGGCTTVGVAGLVQSGGFGSFSKRFGTAAASLLEAQVVTADGAVRVVNAHRDPDLFWALKGGGGGSFGVVTRVTLRTHDLPQVFGGVFGEIGAASDEAFRALVAAFIAFYRTHLFNEHWGEKVALRGRRLDLSMVFQGLDRSAAEATWAPFFAWVGERKEYTFKGPMILSMPARHFWDADYLDKHAPGIMTRDNRPGASADHVVWVGDREQAGWTIHGYESAWLPARLLQKSEQSRLADALVTASREWDVELHFNKGLAGASPEALAASRNTATNPNVLSAFALAIIGAAGAPAFPGMPGIQADATRARTHAAAVGRAMAPLLKVAPWAGAYVSESNYFQTDWQAAYWGTNHARLASVKRRYDPQGLFFVHHGVGSEEWSADGFTRIA